MNAVGSTGRANTAGSRQSISSALRNPGLVLHHGELVVDLVHGHELLLTPSSVRSRHVFHVDGFTIFVGHVSSPIASVVPKAVLDANDDPAKCVRRVMKIVGTRQSIARYVCMCVYRNGYTYAKTAKLCMLTTGL